MKIELQDLVSVTQNQKTKQILFAIKAKLLKRFGLNLADLLCVKIRTKKRPQVYTCVCRLCGDDFTTFNPLSVVCEDCVPPSPSKKLKGGCKNGKKD